MKTTEQLKELIDEIGFDLFDTRLNRMTRVVNGYTQTLDYPGGILKLPEIKEKYTLDWNRMYSTYKKAMYELKKLPHSRRAVIFNNKEYYKAYECFLMIHILPNEKGEYDMVVTQRSSDLSKLKDDISFFEYIMYNISKELNTNVTRLVVNFGSIHYAR